MAKQTPTFEQFVAGRVACKLELLVKLGHEAAIQYAENIIDVENAEVITYKVDGQPALFIDILDNGETFHLALGNEEFNTKTEWLKTLELELYQYACDEGYFED